MKIIVPPEGGVREVKSFCKGEDLFFVFPNIGKLNRRDFEPEMARGEEGGRLLFVSRCRDPANAIAGKESPHEKE